MRFKGLAVAVFGLVVLLGQLAYTADTDFAFVTPGAAFTMTSTGATGAPVGYEWNKQPSAGAWGAFTGATVSVSDTLASRAVARYRLRGYVVGWACNAGGCAESGARNYGEFSDPSDWMIAVTTPGCGKAATPAKP